MRWACGLAVVLASATAVAQPIDPYAEPTKPAKPAKPAKKGKGAKGAKKGKDAKPAPADADGGVLDPYGEEAPTPTPTDSAPRDPYEDAGAPTTTPTPTPTTTSTTTSTSTSTSTTTSTSVVTIDIDAVQGLLPLQSLDGWLLYDRDGQNPIARKLVAPTGNPTRAWFYLVPDEGTPVLLCHQSETGSFAQVAGTQLTYAGYRDLGKQLKALLKKRKTVAMEYSPKGAVPSISRVDAGTIELIKSLGVAVKSSAGLVQFTKALWGPEGRKQHYVAAHHLTELRKDALSWLAAQVSAGAVVTELDVQARIVDGMAMRGLDGPPPVVAAGAHTADPYYVPSATTSAAIHEGDLVVISLAGRTDDPHGIYAATTWVAYVGATVPDKVASAFEVVSLARDEAISLITDRIKRRRAVKGADVDAAARAFVTKAKLGERFTHRTGHALDSDLQGAAADLDDYEVHDTRTLVVGSGFTIGPGVYFAGEFGVRAEVSAYLGQKGLEVTTPKQEAIEALLAK